KGALALRATAAQRDLLFLSNKLSEVQSANIKYKSQLSQLEKPSTTTQAPTLKPAMTPMPSTTIDMNPPALCKKAHNETMKLMHGTAKMQTKPRPEFTPRDLRKITAIQSGMPIPFQTMQSLLKNIERYGVDATNPNVVASMKPTDRGKQRD